MSNNDLPWPYHDAVDDETDDIFGPAWIDNTRLPWIKAPASHSASLEVDVDSLTQSVPFESSFSYAASMAPNASEYMQLAQQTQTESSQVPEQQHLQHLYPDLEQQPSSLAFDRRQQFSPQVGSHLSTSTLAAPGNLFYPMSQQPSAHVFSNFGFTGIPTGPLVRPQGRVRSASAISNRREGPPLLGISTSSQQKPRRAGQQFSRSNNGYDVGKPKDKEYKEYPPGNQPIPKDTPLEELARKYPNHCWNRGLRPFMEAGWSAKKLYDMLPENARQGQDAQRPHNYLQQAMRRQRIEMRREIGLPPLPKKRRSSRRDDKDDSEELGSEYDEDVLDAGAPSQVGSAPYQRQPSVPDQHPRKRRHMTTPLSPAPFQSVEHQQSLPQPCMGSAPFDVVNQDTSSNAQLARASLLRALCQEEQGRNLDLLVSILQHDAARMGRPWLQSPQTIAHPMWLQSFRQWLVGLYGWHGIDSSDISTKSSILMLFMPIWCQARLNVGLSAHAEPGSNTEREAKMWCWAKFLSGLQSFTKAWGQMLHRRLETAAAENLALDQQQGVFATAAVDSQDFPPPQHLAPDANMWVQNAECVDVHGGHRHGTQTMQSDQRVGFAQQTPGLTQPPLQGVPMQHLSNSYLTNNYGPAPSRGGPNMLQAPALQSMISPDLILLHPREEVPRRLTDTGHISDSAVGAGAAFDEAFELIEAEQLVSSEGPAIPTTTVTAREEASDIPKRMVNSEDQDGNADMTDGYPQGQMREYLIDEEFMKSLEPTEDCLDETISEWWNQV